MFWKVLVEMGKDIAELGLKIFLSLAMGIVLFAPGTIYYFLAVYKPEADWFSELPNYAVPLSFLFDGMIGLLVWWVWRAYKRVSND